MISFFIKCFFTWGIITAVAPHTLHFSRIDVSDGYPCAGLLPNETKTAGGCILHDVSLTGRVLHQDYEIKGANGTAEFFTRAPAQAKLLAFAGYTWQTWLVWLIVLLLWLPTLLLSGLNIVPFGTKATKLQ